MHTKGIWLLLHSKQYFQFNMDTSKIYFQDYFPLQITTYYHSIRSILQARHAEKFTLTWRWILTRIHSTGIPFFSFPQFRAVVTAIGRRRTIAFSNPRFKTIATGHITGWISYPCSVVTIYWKSKISVKAPKGTIIIEFKYQVCAPNNEGPAKVNLLSIEMSTKSFLTSCYSFFLYYVLVRISITINIRVSVWVSSLLFLEKLKKWKFLKKYP